MEQSPLASSVEAAKRVESLPILVEFKGNRYWWLKEDDGTGALAPLEHCDENGQIKIETMFELSFAHVYNEGISRFGAKIGTKEDLRFVTRSATSTPNVTGAEALPPNSSL